MCPPALYCCVRLCLAILYICLPALGCCGRLCLAILCLPALDVASSSFDLLGVYGGVISLPGLSLLVSLLFRWPCSISIHLSPRSVAAGVRPFPLAMQHFYSFVSNACHCWCPPFSAGHVAVLFICLPGLSLLVSALFCWPCSTSIHLSPSVRPCPLAM